MTRAAIEYLISDITAIERVLAEYSWLASLLSPEEVAQADRFRRPSDRAAFRGAHLIFRLMAARRLGVDLEEAGELELTRRCRTCGGPHGKPTIPGAELSLSRSNGAVAIASAPGTSPIGVDIEQVPPDVFSGFDDYVLGPAETLTDGGDSVRHRVDLWVCKEAAVKTTGHGLSVPPSDFEVMNLPSGIGLHGPWTATIAAPGNSELDALNISRLICPRPYVAALCSADRLPVEAVGLQEILAGR